jgi:circadian clock protein KaiC
MAGMSSEQPEEDRRNRPGKEFGDTARAPTGIEGLDAVLGGGLQRNRTYLVEGAPGAGKTTLGLQFCIAGASQGERVLFLTTGESEEELTQIALAHGWSLDGVHVHHYRALQSPEGPSDQSVFHPAEVELPRSMDVLLQVIDEVDPQRLVIDSLTEIRLVATDPLWYRRQILTLKENLAQRACTTLLCDRLQDPQPPVQTIANGVISLDHFTPDYGPDRRRLRVTKLRGQSYASGYHDYKIRTGGIELFPRLVAAEHRHGFDPETIPSGVPELDALFGGAADRGTATLLMGPSGTGKSNVACQYALAAAERGEASALYLFDERVQTLLGRTANMGMNLEAQVESGLVQVQQIDPAELTPDEFSHRIRRDVEERGVRLVVIDSLAGYFQAMPNERLLLLHLHELLSYLSQAGVSVLLVMTQHGLPGHSLRTAFDMSYIADSVLLFHIFEHEGALRKAISVYKRRGGPHEQTIRELQFGPDGIRVGEPLKAFQGIITGVPTFRGDVMPEVRDHEHREPRNGG